MATWEGSHFFKQADIRMIFVFILTKVVNIRILY